MPAWTPYRRGIVAALILCLTPLLLLAADPKDAFKTADYEGEVVRLATVLEKQGVHLDPDASPSWLALVMVDGTVHPLVKDDGSRMFFKDDHLLNRRMRLTGRLLPKSGLLQVVQVHSYHSGKLYEVYYWCDICSIRRSEKGNCDCCGGPLVLREEPVQK